MKIHGLKIWLEPDHRIPVFFRLRRERIEVPIKDVLLEGIHPESAMGMNGDWCQAAELFAQQINGAGFRYEPLSVHQLNSDILPIRNGQIHDRRTALESTLESVERHVYFADSVFYDHIVKQAGKYLRQHWSRDHAWNLMVGSRSGFTELRTFLKQKHPKLKIGSYDDMNDLDLAGLLSIDDFSVEEQSIVREGLTCHNFRYPDVLAGLTDTQHRLRFLKRIEWFELVVNPSSAYGHGHVKYTCGLKGNEVHFTPELSHAVEQREFAKKFARRHRATGGEYCFAMPISQVQEILDREQVSLRFPNVRYLQRLKGLQSTARLRKDQIPKFAVSWRRMETLDQFRDALRAHGWKISGKKSDLVKRTAQLAAERYAEIAPLLCEWFSDRRFVRVPKDQTFAEPFPLLEDESLKNLLLSMFLLRHLRGNTVVDAGHENQSVQPEDMAEALLTGKAKLSGCFLKV